MPKGVPKEKYTGEFKQKVVEDMRENQLSLREAARKYNIPQHITVRRWERIYLAEGVKGLYVEHRGLANATNSPQKGRPLKLSNKVENDLISENQRLRMENAVLKKYHALVLEEQTQKSKLK